MNFLEDRSVYVNNCIHLEPRYLSYKYNIGRIMLNKIRYLNEMKNLSGFINSYLSFHNFIVGPAKSCIKMSVLFNTHEYFA
jgi:hypothetical protein